MKPDPNLLKGNLDFILLEILEPAPMYGLEIISEAQSRTDGYFDFKEGSLYPALHRLEQQKQLTAEFIASNNGGPRRKYYAISEQGKQTLAQKRRQWQEFNQAINAIRGTP